MTGDEFIKLATDLLLGKARSPSEALCRTIASRAYYGAFHLARAYVVQLGFPETDKHRFLADCLSASGESSVVRVGDLLRVLATARGKADYDIAIPSVVKQVQQNSYLMDLIERADTVKDLLTKASTTPAKAQAKAGISIYWRQSSSSPSR